MKEYIDEFDEDYVVLMDSDNVLNINLVDVIKSHEITGAKMTLVTQQVDKDYTAKHPRMMLSSVAGKVTDVTMSSAYSEMHTELSLGIIVMSTTYLRKIIGEAQGSYNHSLSGMILRNYKNENFRTYKYDGFVASVSSFLDYYKYSITLAKDEEARSSLLYKKEFPVFTRVHNSAPVVYKTGAKVESSMIADECVIEGTVINSVLFRGVHVAKGAVVKDSVLFRGTYVGKNASLNCIVTDKDVHVNDNVSLSGNSNMPFYVQKNRKV